MHKEAKDGCQVSPYPLSNLIFETGSLTQGQSEGHR